MDYRSAFATALEKVRSEGRYRVFADLKRHRGEFNIRGDEYFAHQPPNLSNTRTSVLYRALSRIALKSSV